MKSLPGNKRSMSGRYLIIGRNKLIRFKVIFLLIAFAALSTTANAEELSPAAYVLVDTSGSMLQTVDETQYTYGDGSLEHPHYDPAVISRMYMAKNAITTIVNAYGEVYWGLARFEQMSGHNYLCMCSDEIPDNYDECGPEGGLWAPEDECRMCDVMTDYPDYDRPGIHDRVCINYAGGLFEGCTDPISGIPLLGADILVPIGPDTQDSILVWVDHSESDPVDPDYDPNLAPEYQVNPELRAVGGTPIGGSLFDIYDHLSWEIGSDPRRGCRPYSIILLTDGDEECDTDPIAAANALLTTPDLQRDCSEGCPLNSECIDGHCRYEVRTHVIAFAVNPNQFMGCHQIALAGNTGGAIRADSEAELVSAMAGIIADSIVVELCNGIDDNCNGLTDEDYPDLGMPCDNGLLGECYCSGVMVCSDDQLGTICAYDPPSETNPCGHPTDEVCDGKDNNCDGIIDNVDPILYPDGCTTPLDLCDPLFPENEGLDDPRVGQPCGTDLGECELGVTVCVEGEVICDQPFGPQPEVCDGKDNNCNGLTDEGLARPCYVHRNGYPVGCTYDGGTDTWSCIGACRTGIQVCDNGEWGPCMGYVNEKDEVCNNIDDNCSGLTDEDLTQYCQITNEWGTCTGFETCEGGSWVDCNAQTPAEEICDGIDNNCDGITDMITQSCYNYTSGCTFNDTTKTWDCLGICRAGTQLCAEGAFGECTGARGPMDELCNGLDDNCDGTTDLDEFGNPLTEVCYTGPAGTEGVGECRAGVRTCLGGMWSGCEGEVTPQQEVCDGKDNNCSGLTDDGLGQTTCGLGECEKTIDNCVDGIAQVCDPFEGATPEVCDGRDNNCDGITDGLIEPCYTFAEGCEFDPDNGTWQCEGMCTTGIRRCPTPQQGGTGEWGPCEFQQGPTDEVCDGRDNNCNGFTDEDLSRPCQVTNEWGTCTGVETCDMGLWVGCDAQIPAEEICDGIDNNCDGITDMVTRGCYDLGDGCTFNEGTQTWSCVGECRLGTQLCVDGEYGECSGPLGPSDEVCDGLDNNCDGQIDKDEFGNPLTQVCYTGPPETEGVGECRAGVRSCTNGVWGACVGEVTPQPEVCDGRDNDCNGLTDDGLGQTTCGLGECRNTIDNCVNGVAQVCDPFEGATPEVCDGLDNNCDGVTDGLIEVCYTFDTGCVFDEISQTWNCEGICTTGIRRCPTPEQGGTGVWWPCEYQQGPQDEVCDGRDNNCNGLTDEDEHGNPLSQACYPPGSGPDTGCELNPDTNEWECLGICRAGERLCIDGAWDPCTGYVTPQAEICNNLDDNCDGQTDEPENLVGLGQPCGSAIGRCTQGIMECIDGQEVCVGGEGPFPGDCNGMDDNCDGVIDDPDEVSHLEGHPCGSDVGECEFGETKCVGGEIICVGGRGPTEEICNGLDDDCNGLIDDGAVCPPGSYCYDGACRPVCDPGDEFSCPPQTDCVEVFIDSVQDYRHICLPSVGDCGGETCPEGWICVNEVCVDPCEGVECEPWEECRNGICMDQSCTAFGIDCPPGQICVNHECVDDPCLGTECDADTEFCVRKCDDTGCTHECGKLCACPPGERCTSDAECIEDLCHEVSCTGATRCNPETGECEPDPCFGITCSTDKVCYEGECIDDPCGYADCPPGYECALVDTGGSTPSAQCRAKHSFWDPGAGTVDVLATGKGGCSCRTSSRNSHRNGPFGLLLLMLLSLVARGSKKKPGCKERRIGR